MLLRASGPLELMAEGPTTRCELRLNGRAGWWVLRLGSTDSLSAFVERFAGLMPQGAGPRDSLRVHDPEYGMVIFEPDGRVMAEGRVLAPSDWTVEGVRIKLPAMAP